MPVGMWKSDNTPITRYIKTLHRYEAHQIWHATLDGQPHMQTIGTASEVVDVELWAYKSGKEIIDICQAIGEPVKVSNGIDTWTGIIADAPSWERINMTIGVFKTKISVKVLKRDA